MNLRLRLANLALHAVHLAIVFFIILGWLFPSARAFHLAFIIGTLLLWWRLGYCPLTRWHWAVRKAAGMAPAQGPYIPFVLSQLLRRPVDAPWVDKVVVRVTLLAALASMLVNARARF